jgi:hypothetical protein
MSKSFDFAAAIRRRPELLEDVRLGGEEELAGLDPVQTTVNSATVTIAASLPPPRA